MSPGPDDKRPRRKKNRSGKKPDPAKFPFGESINPNDSDADAAKFPFGETMDESDEALGIPGASTTGDEPGEIVSTDDLDEPTLRAMGLAGSMSGEYDDSDLGSLVDSDLGALDTSGDVIRDTGEHEPEEIFDSASSLPSMPPGSTPDDDASLAGIGSGVGEVDDDYDPMFTPSELGRVSDMGPIGPSGPLVIVDDDAQSTRFSASVAGDDSVRIAGARSARKPRQRGKKRPAKKTPEPPLQDFEASWDEGELDPDVPVPTVSARGPKAKKGSARGKKATAGGKRATGKGKRGSQLSKSARSGVGAAAPASEAPPKRRKLVVLLLLLLLSSCGVSVGLEWKRRTDVKRLQGEHRAALETLRTKHEAELANTRTGLQQALDLARGESGQLSGRLEGVQSKLTEARLALDTAQAEQRSQREAFDDELDTKLEAERERMLRERAAALEVELATALEEALEAERDEVQAKIAAAVEDAQSTDQEELTTLRTRNADLERALEAEREARKRAEEALQRAREGANNGSGSTSDDHADSGGGGDGGASELDDFFGDGPASRSGSSGGSGSELDDFFGDGPASRSGSSGGSGSELDGFFGDSGGDSSDGPQPDAPAEPDQPNALVRGWEAFTSYVHGNLGYRHFSHFSRDGNQKTRNEAYLNLEFDHWYWFKENRTAGVRVVANLEARADDDDLYGGSWEGIDDETEKRPYVVPNELYAGLLYEAFEMRVGYQRFAWGTGDLFNPTDQLNPTDFSDMFASRRIPVFSAMVNLNLQYEFGGIEIELISIPTFTRSRVPLSGTRFDPLADFPLTVLRPDDPDGDLQDTQWGTRVILHAKGWDIGLSGFTGFDDFPAGQLATVVIFPPIVQVEPVFDRIHMVGADFATTLGSLGVSGPTGDLLSRIQLHAEAAHTFYEGPRADEVLQYVFGINYTFVDVISEHDLTLILEYAGELVTKEAEASAGSNLGRVLSGAVLMRLQYEVSPQPMLLLKDLNFALNFVVNLDGAENGYVHPEMNYTVTDYLTVQLAGDVFFGPDDTFFGQYERDGRVIVNAKLSF